MESQENIYKAKKKKKKKIRGRVDGLVALPMCQNSYPAKSRGPICVASGELRLKRLLLLSHVIYQTRESMFHQISKQ